MSHTVCIKIHHLFFKINKSAEIEKLKTLLKLQSMQHDRDLTVREEQIKRLKDEIARLKDHMNISKDDLSFLQ
jgi:ribosomal protein S15P/S13E